MSTIPLLVSPDDHVQAPGHVWTSRLPANLRDQGPTMRRLRGVADLGRGEITFVEDDEGSLADVWSYDGRQVPIVRIAAAAGLPRSEVGPEPCTLDDIRKGCWDPTARLADMDTAGIEASVCYPNLFVRFCGQRFSLAQDKDLALRCIQAYNDWIVEEWCGGSNGRLAPMGIVPLWDPALATAEVERIAALGFRSISFSEAPHLLGFASVASKQWDPMLAACAEAGIVVSLHVGSGSFSLISRDAPIAVANTVPGLYSAHALVDLLFSGVFARYPALKVCFAEAQMGWVPYVLERADHVWLENDEGFNGIDKAEISEPPSHYFRQNVWLAFFRDPVGLAILDRIGVDKVLYETDFPHLDTEWPNCRAVAEELTSGLSREDAAKVVAGNARSLFRIETSAG